MIDLHIIPNILQYLGPKIRVYKYIATAHLIPYYKIVLNNKHWLSSTHVTYNFVA